MCAAFHVKEILRLHMSVSAWKHFFIWSQEKWRNKRKVRLTGARRWRVLILLFLGGRGGGLLNDWNHTEDENDGNEKDEDGERQRRLTAGGLGTQTTRLRSWFKESSIYCRLHRSSFLADNRVTPFPSSLVEMSRSSLVDWPSLFILLKKYMRLHKERVNSPLSQRQRLTVFFTLQVI